MFIALSFIGKLPEYIVECVHQIRCYFDKDIYLIIDDLNSPHLPIVVDKYRVIIIDYSTVYSAEFNNVIKVHGQRIHICHTLKGRELLFMRSLERFFLLDKLMKQHGLDNALFLELDNLIYDNPENWLEKFNKHELCYLYDNDDRCSSGLMYVRTRHSLDPLINYILSYIHPSSGFINEMTALYRFNNMAPKKVQILPTYWSEPDPRLTNDTVPEIAYKNFGLYGDSIFDALPIGCFLLGMDPIHTNGVIKTGLKDKWGKIDYTNQQFEWKLDDQGRRRP